MMPIDYIMYGVIIGVFIGFLWDELGMYLLRKRGKKNE